MFAYPQQAEFNRVVPKTKIFAHGKISKRLREAFAAQVSEIIWKFKLSPETLNLPTRNGIEEIQVFELHLKTGEFDPAVPQAIDKTIPFPILFHFVHDGQIRYATSYKRPSQADAKKWVSEGFFVTAPQSVGLPTLPLPIALDLASLYEQIVCRHVPLQARKGESLADLISRFHALQAKEFALRQLENRMAQEVQFNRKVEMNRQLRQFRRDLQDLS